MKLHKAKAMCFAIHYNKGVLLNWKQKTIDKMEKHRNRYNTRFNQQNKTYKEMNNG